jgi:hypothetical protein
MDILYSRCCGLDVHKSSLTACILVNGFDGKQRHVRRFGTMTRDVTALANWLTGHDVQKLAMESTGVYWKPIWNLLEDRFDLMLVNAQHIKAVPGRKTDIKDCEWVAELLQHGLLRGSFVPPEPVRELRDLNRNRAILVQQRATVSNRIEKVLEDANIKLASVASHLLGRSGRTMLQAMVDGISDPAKLADMARAKLRNKIPELRSAFEGRFEERHRFSNGGTPRSVAVPGRYRCGVRAENRGTKSAFSRQDRVADDHPRRGSDYSQQQDRGDRRGYEPVSDCATPGFLGRDLSGQQRKWRQALQRQDTQREPMVETHSLPGGLGGVTHEEHLFGRAVPSPCGQARQATRNRGGGTQYPRSRVLHVERERAVSGSGRKLL